MAYGLNQTNVIQPWLNTLSGTALASNDVLCSHAQLHTADPGSAGTTGVFTNVDATRKAISWAATSGNSRALSAAVEWTATGAGTVTGLSAWNASSAGNFRFSASFTSRTLATNDILRLTALTFTLTPVAA
jgi:hypothetical protein